MAMHGSPEGDPVGDPEAGAAAECMAVAAELVRRACAADVGRLDEVLLSLSLALGFLEAALTVKDAAQRLWPAQLKVTLFSQSWARGRVINIYSTCCYCLVPNLVAARRQRAGGLSWHCFGLGPSACCHWSKMVVRLAIQTHQDESVCWHRIPKLVALLLGV
jgi:hypothetical protein